MLLDKRASHSPYTCHPDRNQLSRIGNGEKGTASLVTQQHYYADLHISIDEDIKRIETSITFKNLCLGLERWLRG